MGWTTTPVISSQERSLEEGLSSGGRYQAVEPKIIHFSLISHGLITPDAVT